MQTKARLSHTRRLVTAFMLLLVGTLSFADFSDAPSVSAQQTKTVLIVDSRFRYEPLLGDFDVQVFLENRSSALATYMISSIDGRTLRASDVIKEIALQYQIAPQVLLVLMQMGSGVVDEQQLISEKVERPMGLLPEVAVGFRDQIEWVAKKLDADAPRYYEVGDDQPQELSLADGSKVTIPGGQNPSSALLRLAAITSPEARAMNTFADNFEMLYQEYYSVHPLSFPDEIRARLVDARLPFVGIKRYTGGPHGADTTLECARIAIGSGSGIDFARTTMSEVQDWEVLSILPGTLLTKELNVAGGIGNRIRIKHSIALVSEYWHLAEFSPEINGKNIGDAIPQGFPIGKAGATGGQGAIHLHLELRTPSETRIQWDGETIDGYLIGIHKLFHDQNLGYNYQGSAVLGSTKRTQITADCNPNFANNYALVGTNYNRPNEQNGADRNTIFADKRFDPYAGKVRSTNTRNTGIAAAVQISPAGNITDNTPVYSWQKVNAATSYLLWIGKLNSNNSVTPVHQAEFAASAVCGNSCSVTPNVTLGAGSHKWWVRSLNSSGGTWSSGMTFNVQAVAVPVAATLISPSGMITSSSPTYQWNRVNLATWYFIEVVNSSGTRILGQWIPDGSCVNSTCSFRPGGTLAGGGYRWRIQTWSEAGYGPWSNYLNFTVGTAGVPSAATLVSPSGIISTNSPTYTWNSVNSATWYFLEVVNSAGGVIVGQWLPSSGVCSGSSCSATPGGTLSNGSYRWRIQTWNEAGYGPWSNAMNFSVSIQASGFDSQFNGSSTGWQAHTGSWYIANNAWYTAVGLPNRYASISYTGTFSTLDYQASLFRIAGNFETCLLIRGSPNPLNSVYDWDSGYAFCYTTDGYYAVYKSIGGGEWFFIQTWTYTPYLNLGEQWNVLRIIANGSELYFFVNGEFVWSGTDTSIASGRVGIQFGGNNPLQGDQLWIDWATLTTNVPFQIMDTISAEQQALNKAAQEAPSDKYRLPGK